MAVEAATFSLTALVGQEGFDLSSAHLMRVPDVVEKDVALNPVDVGLLCADGIVFEADGASDSIEQFQG